MILPGDIRYEEDACPPEEQVLALYRANHWSSAEKPGPLMRSLANSHSLVTAWAGVRLVGLGNSISDGHLVVYYPHLLVLPECHGLGIGRGIMDRLMRRYKDFHQQILVADGGATGFYERCGFKKAGRTTSMWIYSGNDH